MTVYISEAPGISRGNSTMMQYIPEAPGMAAGRETTGAEETRPARPLLVVALAGADARPNVEEVGSLGI